LPFFISFCLFAFLSVISRLIYGWKRPSIFSRIWELRRLASSHWGLHCHWVPHSHWVPLTKHGRHWSRWKLSSDLWLILEHKNISSNDYSHELRLEWKLKLLFHNMDS
jgi:hypothetical protein